MQISENERLDDLEIDGLKIIQNKELFCFGIDAVLLSHFIKVGHNEVLADFGTGSGVIPLIVYGIFKPKYIYGIEYQKKSFELAVKNVGLNKLENKISIINADIREMKKLYKDLLFDVISFNPPYMKSGGGIENESDEKKIARHEIIGCLDDYIRVASLMLKNRGRLYLVYRPSRLIELINIMSKYKIEAKRIRFVHPQKGKNANLVLVEGIKNAGAELKIEDPLFVYNNGEYTKELLEIYGKI